MKKCAEENDTPGESEPEKNAILGRTKIVTVNVGVSCLLSMVERVLQAGVAQGNAKGLKITIYFCGRIRSAPKLFSLICVRSL